MTLNSGTGPADFEERYPAVVDSVLKQHYPMAVRMVPSLRKAVVAGLWLGLVTESSRDAASLLKRALEAGFDAYDAAVSVARGCGWAEGQVVEGWERTPVGRAALATD